MGLGLGLGSGVKGLGSWGWCSIPQRLTNGGVVAESWLILEGLVQVVLAVLRTQLAAVAVVARDQPLAAWVGQRRWHQYRWR